MAVTHTRFTYTDSYGVKIFAQKWAPADHSPGWTGPIAGDQNAVDPTDLIGAVQIVHGICEHSDRYSQFAHELANAGFVVYADDHRGHGRTGIQQHRENPDQMGKLGPGGLLATEAAITQLTSIIREAHPGIYVTVFAHSWGSLMAQRILNRTPNVWDAVVLSGTAYRTPAHMNSGDLNAGFEGPTDYNWLSRDLNVGIACEEDPMRFKGSILNLFGVADSLRLFGTPAAGLNPKTPLLITGGTADSLSQKDGLQKLAAAYRKRGLTDVTLRLYQDGRHEMLNEINRDEFVGDVMTWITDRAMGY